jgi:hypothetical protein
VPIYVSDLSPATAKENHTSTHFLHDENRSTVVADSYQIGLHYVARVLQWVVPMVATDKTHDAFIRLQNIRSLIADEARRLRARGESDASGLDMLLAAEEQIKAEFESSYLSKE